MPGRESSQNCSYSTKSPTSNDGSTRCYKVIIFVFNLEHGRPSEEDFYQMMKDSSVMVGLHHENLSPVIATCLDSQLGRPLKLVYLAWSDDDNLRLYLQRCRHSQVMILTGNLIVTWSQVIHHTVIHVWYTAYIIQSSGPKCCSAVHNYNCF